MNFIRYKIPALSLTGVVFSVGCGAQIAGRKHHNQSSGGAENATVAKDDTQIDTKKPDEPAPVLTGKEAKAVALRVLDPAALARKAYDAFGSGMTKYKMGNMTVDYVVMNEASFGTVSSNPMAKSPDRDGISFRIALSGLAGIIGNNYLSALYAGTAAADCRELAGAKRILSKIAPDITDAEVERIAPLIVKGCTENVANTISSIVQSASFFVKS